jgi:hypothetical protein
MRAFQYRFLAKDGTYVWLETVVRGLDEQLGVKDGRFLSQTRSFQKHREGNLDAIAASLTGATGEL